MSCLVIFPLGTIHKWDGVYLLVAMSQIEYVYSPYNSMTRRAQPGNIIHPHCGQVCYTRKTSQQHQSSLNIYYSRWKFSSHCKMGSMLKFINTISTIHISFSSPCILQFQSVFQRSASSFAARKNSYNFYMQQK